MAARPGPARRTPFVGGSAVPYPSVITPTELVRGLYGAYQARDWARARAYLHPGVVVRMPATAEQLDGAEAVLAFQASYPEPWGELAVGRVLEEGGLAAAEVTVLAPDGGRFGFAAFWETRDGLLSRGIEYWILVGGESQPTDRASSQSSRAARLAWDRDEQRGAGERPG